MNNNIPSINSHILGLKAIPLKVSIFTWRLFLILIHTKDNLFKRRVLHNNNKRYMRGCSMNENVNPLFFR